MIKREALLCWAMTFAVSFATVTGPVITPDFPDPAILKVGSTL
jgi:hypothetical protein